LPPDLKRSGTVALSAFVEERIAVVTSTEWHDAAPHKTKRGLNGSDL
jgi:hypothetical protein